MNDLPSCNGCTISLYVVASTGDETYYVCMGFLFHVFHVECVKFEVLSGLQVCDEQHVISINNACFVFTTHV